MTRAREREGEEKGGDERERKEREREDKWNYLSKNRFTSSEGEVTRKTNDLINCSNGNTIIANDIYIHIYRRAPSLFEVLKINQRLDLKRKTSLSCYPRRRHRINIPGISGFQPILFHHFSLRHHRRRRVQVQRNSPSIPIDVVRARKVPRRFPTPDNSITFKPILFSRVKIGPQCRWPPLRHRTCGIKVKSLSIVRGRLSNEHDTLPFVCSHHLVERDEWNRIARARSLLNWFVDIIMMIGTCACVCVCR